MDNRCAQTPYADLANEFRLALNRALRGAIPAATALTGMPLTLALLDVCHAVRQRRPVRDLVSRACAEFTDFAAERDEARHRVSAPDLTAVR